MLRQRLFFSVFITLACLALPAHAQTTATSPTPTTPAQTERSFEQWQREFQHYALEQGIETWVLEQAFSGLTPDPSIVQADQSQPEFTRAVWQYLQGAITSWRIARGKALLSEHRRTLDAIEAKYQVDRHILVAIWGLESNFGRQMGNKSIIRSLATLAYQGRRAEFWQAQLIAALRILQAGDVTPKNMLGSWAGAFGQTQFMPTTYLDYAVDFNGDGKRDIWHSTADALASAANYLKSSGWQAEQPWGYEVQLPTVFDYALADGDQQKTLQEWLDLGVNPRQQMLFNEDQLQQPASILLPSGYRGPAYLQLNNFRSILKYNQSTSYALAVGLLANSLAGETFNLHRWPKEDLPLSRTERFELQNLLAGLGFSSGEVDGIIGANSRKAIRGFQQKYDLPADGHATHRLLERVRETSQRQHSSSP